MVPFSQLVIRKTLARSALLATCLSLSGCDPLTDLLLDCIDDDGPVLSPRVIPNPVLNQSYDVRITASIDNEPYDDSFRYDIDVSRTLPPGLIADVFERQVRITGAPTELGNYSIDIGVRVEDPYHSYEYGNEYGGTSSGLCRHYTQRIYHMTVMEEF